jgi:hypothetical protein
MAIARRVGNKRINFMAVAHPVVAFGTHGGGINSTSARLRPRRHGRFGTAFIECLVKNFAVIELALSCVFGPEQ